MQVISKTTTRAWAMRFAMNFIIIFISPENRLIDLSCVIIYLSIIIRNKKGLEKNIYISLKVGYYNPQEIFMKHRDRFRFVIPDLARKY
jgi:hypothetical protein